MDPFHISDPFDGASDPFHASSDPFNEPSGLYHRSSVPYHGLSDPFQNAYQPRRTRPEPPQRPVNSSYYRTPAVLQRMPKVMLSEHQQYPRPDMQALYERLIRMMLEDRRPLTVLELKRKMPKKKRKAQTIKQLNYLLYDNEQKGFIQSLPPVMGSREQQPRWILATSNQPSGQAHQMQSRDYYPPDFNRSSNIRSMHGTFSEMENDRWMRTFNAATPLNMNMPSRQTNISRNSNFGVNSGFNYWVNSHSRHSNVPNNTNLGPNHPLTKAINAKHPLIYAPLEQKIRWMLRQLTRLRIGPATALHIRHCITVSFNMPRKPKIIDVNSILHQQVENGFANQVQDPERRCWRYVLARNNFR